MTGEFPVFFSGQNNVSWTGAISKIEATPNWRCY
jgi:phage-related protein